MGRGSEVSVAAGVSMGFCVGMLVLVGLGRSRRGGGGVLVSVTVGVEVGEGEGTYVCVGVSDRVADGGGRDGLKLSCVRIG